MIEGNFSSRRALSAALLVAGAALLPMTPAFAQDSDDLRIRVGAGAQSRPQYVGADSNEFAPLFDFAMKRGTEQFDFGAPDDSFDIKLYSQNGFSVGPVANYQSGRKNSDVGEPVGRVDPTIEAGIFLQYQMNESLRLRGEFRKGFGGHKGGIASLGADYVMRDGDRYTFSIGPRVLLSDGRYQRAWFGVTPQAALLTDLDEYRPSGGIHGVAATSSMTYQLGGAFGLFGFARAERLVGDAADSPLIRELGSKTQLSAGLGLTYTFKMKN